MRIGERIKQRRLELGYTADALAKMLNKKEKYEKIEEMTVASTATISRVKRCLAYGADGYIKVLERMEAQAEKVDNTNE